MCGAEAAEPLRALAVDAQISFVVFSGFCAISLQTSVKKTL
jgi:hypothetical protein